MSAPVQRLALLGAITALLVAAAAVVLLTRGDDGPAPKPLNAEELAHEAEQRARENSREAVIERQRQNRKRSEIDGEAGAQQARTGEPAPEFELPGQGGEVSLADYEGQPLVIEFAQSTCPHCQAMAPVFDQVMRAHPDVAFLVVGVSEPAKATRKWHKSFLGHAMPGDVAFDPDLDAARLYGVVGTPTTAFIDADGVLRDLLPGEMSAADLESRIEKIAG